MPRIGITASCGSYISRFMNFQHDFQILRTPVFVPIVSVMIHSDKDKMES